MGLGRRDDGRAEGERLTRGGRSSAQGCIRSERASEAAPAVGQAVGGGCQSGWGRLLSVTNAVEAGTCRQGDSGWGWAWRPGGRGVTSPPSDASLVATPFGVTVRSALTSATRPQPPVTANHFGIGAHQTDGHAHTCTHQTPPPGNATGEALTCRVPTQRCSSGTPGFSMRHHIEYYLVPQSPPLQQRSKGRL